MVYEIAIKRDKTHCFFTVILFCYNKKERYSAKRKNYDFFIIIIIINTIIIIILFIYL